jgi:hypothetical protein
MRDIENSPVLKSSQATMRYEEKTGQTEQSGNASDRNAYAFPKNQMFMLKSSVSDNETGIILIHVCSG